MEGLVTLWKDSTPICRVDKEGTSKTLTDAADCSKRNSRSTDNINSKQTSTKQPYSSDGSDHVERLYTKYNITVCECEGERENVCLSIVGR